MVKTQLTNSQVAKAKSSRPYKSRSQRPCDFCRRRKTCCIIEGSIPCTPCIQFNKGNCTFNEGPMKRNNKAESKNSQAIKANNTTKLLQPEVMKRQSHDQIDFSKENVQTTRKIRKIRTMDDVRLGATKEIGLHPVNVDQFQNAAILKSQAQLSTTCNNSTLFDVDVNKNIDLESKLFKSEFHFSNHGNSSKEDAANNLINKPDNSLKSEIEPNPNFTKGTTNDYAEEIFEKQIATANSFIPPLNNSHMPIMVSLKDLDRVNANEYNEVGSELTSSLAFTPNRPPEKQDFAQLSLQSNTIFNTNNTTTTTTTTTTTSDTMKSPKFEQDFSSLISLSSNDYSSQEEISCIFDSNYKISPLFVQSSDVISGLDDINSIKLLPDINSDDQYYKLQPDSDLHSMGV